MHLFQFLNRIWVRFRNVSGNTARRPRETIHILFIGLWNDRTDRQTGSDVILTSVARCASVRRRWRCPTAERTSSWQCRRICTQNNKGTRLILPEQKLQLLLGFSVAGPTGWNSLPNPVQNCKLL